MAEEMSPLSIAAVFRYDRDTLARWLRAGRGKRYQLYMLIFGILAVNFIFAIPSAQHKGPPVFLTAVCLVALGLVFYRSRLSDKGMPAVDALYNGGEEYRLFLREEGFSFKTAGREGEIPFSSIREADESDSCFRIYYGDKEVFVIPKEALREEQSAALGHLLGERLGKNYRWRS